MSIEINLFFSNVLKQLEKPQEGVSLYQRISVMFWNITCLFFKEGQRGAQRSKWILCTLLVDCFQYFVIYMTCFKTVNAVKNYLCFFYFSALSFPYFSFSVRKCSQDTSSSHWVPRSRSWDYGERLEYLYGRVQRCTADRVGPCLSANAACQSNKIKVRQACAAFICLWLIVVDRQTGAERPPSALMMTNEQADEISWWPYWDVKTREEFMCRDFYETSGERVITNEYTRLIVRSLPWKQYHCESCHVPCL